MEIETRDWNWQRWEIVRGWNAGASAERTTGETGLREMRIQGT